jgi:hypothetical protein
MARDTQITLSFAPPPPSTQIPLDTPSQTRGTPRRTASRIINYRKPEQIDEPFRNPAPTPRVAKRVRDGDTNFDNTKERGIDKDSGSGEEDEELTIIDDPATPSRSRNLTSTVTIKRRKIEKKTRKRMAKRSWTISYFNITDLDEEWTNTNLKGNPI